MRLASFVISFCLHAGFVLLALFWPSPPPYRLDSQPMTVSLVDGLPGGNLAPSPILGPQGSPAQKQTPPLPSAPSKPSSPPEAVPLPIEKTQPQKLEAPDPVPAPIPEPKPDAAAPAQKKQPEAKKPETPKEEDKKPKQPEKARAPKEEAKKTETPRAAPARQSPAEAAIARIRAAKSTPGEIKVKPNAVAQALAAARKESGGHEGGGGGEGDGEGGGGLGDVYAAQIVMAVQPNWHWPAQAKGSLSVALYLKIDAGGRVLDVRVEESSGNAVFDSSAVSAVRVTHTLPPPPSTAYREIILNFFPMQ